jgi:hypothetical protein
MNFSTRSRISASENAGKEASAWMTCGQRGMSPINRPITTTVSFKNDLV